VKVDIIAGARPNFMKIAPIIEAIKNAAKSGKKISYRLVHTGQHYDEKMSGDFFKQLDIPLPDVNLEVGSGTQAEQTGRIMMKYEALLMEEPCDLVIVVGDVTSTMACSIAAKKLNIKVAHVEGGIRSGDLSMPEEINRMVTDSISDYFFTTSEFANINLRKLGFPEETIVFVGNTMIDTLLKQMDNFRKPSLWSENNLEEKKYFVITLHRPANVDDPSQLAALLKEIFDHTQDYKIVFPVHPRTRKMLDQINFKHERLVLSEPMGYLEFNYLVQHSFAVITDSGGITEETTVMGIPCFTLRNNTERPETCTIGTNELIGTNPKDLRPYLEKLFAGEWKKGVIPPLWDGHTAERIVSHLVAVNSL
jgi:UDP-N-acetylglucosamine 2-epimerase (non-hydrolysing)